MQLTHENHPCFNDAVRHTHARIHLPVAPRCNVQCNFCDRRYDCVNESRPGVTSGILTPAQAEIYLKEVTKKIPNLSVVGIAGPGDPFANPEESMETLTRVREAFPEMLLCIATNGLNLPEYVHELAKLKVSHVTITVNAIDPKIGKKIYGWFRIGKRTYTGEEGAKKLLEQQKLAIKLLKTHGILVKINSILIPGINDSHIPEVAAWAADLGADIFNCVPLYKNPGSVFGHIESPSTEMTKKVREEAAKFLPQMSHCQRCRADAAGILGEGTPDFAQKALKEAQKAPVNKLIFKVTEERPYIAVASREGILINQHLGETTDFLIYKQEKQRPTFLEKRVAPLKGKGDLRWEEVAKILSDCSVLLTNGIGERPLKIFKQSDLNICVVEGLIQDAIKAIFEKKDISYLINRNPHQCGQACSGTGGGCG